VIANQTMQIVMVGDESQAIYGWRGARDAMGGFHADHVVNLSESFRFGPAVAAFANKFLDLLDAPLRITGVGPESTVEVIEAPDAILTRTNAGAIEHAMEQLELGRKVALVGKMAAEIASFVNAAEKLMDGKRVQHADLAAFKTWGEVIEYVGTEEGRDLKMLVSLIDKYGITGLRQVVESTVKPSEADVTISTAHKAKGLEWGTVKIGGDFKVRTEDDQPISRAELMLMYVACTRAMKTLDPGILAGV
jgi:ATP-dependent exoDNAse (exonuclease V) beta subunit